MPALIYVWEAAGCGSIPHEHSRPRQIGTRHAGGEIEPSGVTTSNVSGLPPSFARVTTTKGGMWREKLGDYIFVKCSLAHATIENWKLRFWAQAKTTWD